MARRDVRDAEAGLVVGACVYCGCQVTVQDAEPMLLVVPDGVSSTAAHQGCFGGSYQPWLDRVAAQGDDDGEGIRVAAGGR